jgi:hypothetical protein
MLGISSHPLYWAAELIGCTTKALVQLAIEDQLDICAQLPRGLKAVRVNADGHIVDMNQQYVTGSRLVKIPVSALSEYLVDKRAHISIFKSYDEPDIFYQLDDQWRFGEFSLVVMNDDLKRLSKSLTAQEAIIDPYIDLPKRADLIDLVSLSKAIARRYNMTNAEASLWLANRIEIEPAQAFYDISGFTLPKRIHEIKAEKAPTHWFNQYWWEHPRNESRPMSRLNSTRVNGIAISKADAEKYSFIPSNELEEPTAEKLPLNADALGVVIRVNLIDLISLSRAIAKHQKMTSVEACEWVTGDIIRKQLLVYSLTSIALPRLIESSERMEILALCYELWAEHPDTDGVEIERFGINVNQVAISKADAEECFSMPSSAFEEPPSQQQLPIPQLYVEKNEPSHDKSSQLRALNQASLLWKNADRDDKTTWTDTKDVIAFLVGKGFSKTLAVRGASIVRPDWAESGRIPKE